MTYLEGFKTNKKLDSSSNKERGRKGQSSVILSDSKKLNDNQDTYNMWEKMAVNKIQQGKLHGDRIGRKKEGYSRIIFENFDGLAPWKHTNDKLDIAKRFLKRYEDDFYAGTECRDQWDLLYNKQKLTNLFKTECAIFTVTAHNIHEQISRSQEGVTAMMMFDNLASVVKEKGVDKSGLGRWCWMLIQGKNNHRTRLITAYQPCRCNKKANSAVYAQQRRYHRLENDFRCPIFIFKNDLLQQLETWKERGERIILMIDANENLYSGKLQKGLMKLGMRDLVRERSKTMGPATHFKGTDQIDGIFATQDVDCMGACFLPFWTGIGDHRPIIVDIPNQVLYGEQLLKIIKPNIRKLQCQKKSTREKYIKELKKLFSEHKIMHKTETLYARTKYPLQKNLAVIKEEIDVVRKECMLAAEKSAENGRWDK